MTGATNFGVPDGMRYRGEHVVVTGGGSGIGRAMAFRFASEGAKVTILDQQREAGETVASEIRASGQACDVIATDVSDAGNMREAFAVLGDMTVLVNNAGIAHVGTVESTLPEDMDRLYAVNVRGVYLAMHVGVPILAAKGRGAILNLASIASKIGIADRFAYSMSKGAVLAMTLSVAKDYVHKGIRCNCVCPARVNTPFVQGYLAKNYPNNSEEMFNELSTYQPIGRMGEPEEVASLAAFLCSDEAAFITGAAYDLDGGVIHLR